MLGGRTVDVSPHGFLHFTGLTQRREVSMYDGMAAGHNALDKLGAEITAYATDRQ